MDEIKVTIYPCKYGKPDKSHPLETTINAQGMLSVPDEILKTWVESGCSVCSGTGNFAQIHPNNIKIEHQCNCAYKRLYKQLDEEIYKIIVERQKKHFEQRMEIEARLHSGNAFPDFLEKVDAALKDKEAVSKLNWKDRAEVIFNMGVNYPPQGMPRNIVPRLASMSAEQRSIYIEEMKDPEKQLEQQKSTEQVSTVGA